MKPVGITVYGLNYAPEDVGIGPYTAGLAEHLAGLGHEVSVVAAVPHYPAWRVAAGYGRRRTVTHEAGVRVTRLWVRMPSPMNGLQRALFELSFLVQALVERPAGDIVVGVSPGLGSGLAAAVHGRLSGRRVVMILQDLAGQGLQQSGLNSHRLLARVVGAAERFVIKRAHAVIVITESFVPHLLAMGIPARRISVLPNWSRLPVAPPAVGVGVGDPRRPVTFVHAGSMGIKQGLEQLIDVARIAAERRLPWRFVLVGDGSERRRLERSAAGLANVEFRDPVDGDAFPAVLAAADVLLVCQAPSNLDMSFPSKLTSYFAAQRPVVACVPPGGSVAGFLRSSGAGLAVPAGQPDELLGALLAITTDPAVGRRILHAARAHLETHWSAASLLPRWAAAVLGPYEARAVAPAARLLPFAADDLGISA